MHELLILILSLCRPTRILPWVLFLAIVCVGWLAMENATLQKYFAERDRRNNHHEAVEQLKKEKKRLEKVEAALKTNGFAAEKAVRERQKMIRPGEKIIFIEDPNSTGSQPIGAAERFPTPTTDTLTAKNQDTDPTKSAANTKAKVKAKGKAPKVKSQGEKTAAEDGDDAAVGGNGANSDDRLAPPPKRHKTTRKSRRAAKQEAAQSASTHSTDTPKTE